MPGLKMEDFILSALECYKAIRDYLDYRKRCGENIQIEVETGTDIEIKTKTGINKKIGRRDSEGIPIGKIHLKVMFHGL
jgi:hypothetical protein